MANLDPPFAKCAKGRLPEVTVLLTSPVSIQDADHFVFAFYGADNGPPANN